MKTDVCVEFFFFLNPLSPPFLSMNCRNVFTVDDEDDDESNREVFAISDLQLGDLTDLSDLPEELRAALAAPSPAPALLKRSPLFRDSPPVLATAPKQQQQQPRQTELR